MLTLLYLYNGRKCKCIGRGTALLEQQSDRLALSLYTQLLDHKLHWKRVNFLKHGYYELHVYVRWFLSFLRWIFLPLFWQFSYILLAQWHTYLQSVRDHLKTTTLPTFNHALRAYTMTANDASSCRQLENVNFSQFVCYNYTHYFLPTALMCYIPHFRFTLFSAVAQTVPFRFVVERRTTAWCRTCGCCRRSFIKVHARF